MKKFISSIILVFLLISVAISAPLGIAHNDFYSMVLSSFDRTFTSNGVLFRDSEGNYSVDDNISKAELNVLDGITSDVNELNVLDGVTAGTVTASKAVVVDSNKDLASLRNLTLTAVILEGSTADDNEMTITCEDPTADRTATLPDYTGGVPLVIAQGFTQTAIADVCAIDVTGSALSVADGWNTAGKAIQWTLAGTKTGANGTLMIYLYIDDGIQCTLTSGGNTAGDWQAVITMFEHTDTAHQTITGTLICADGMVTDLDTDTTDFGDGAATDIKCQIDLGHADDSATVDIVSVAHWKK